MRISALGVTLPGQEYGDHEISTKGTPVLDLWQNNICHVAQQQGQS